MWRNYSWCLVTFYYPTFIDPCFANSSTHSLDDFLMPLFNQITVLWHIIRDHYFNMVMNSINVGRFLKGITKELINVIFKSRNKKKFQNWWAISLINIVYKIFIKTLQLHLQLLFMEMTNSNQTVFFLLPYILDNVLFMHETTNWTRSSMQKHFPWRLYLVKMHDKFFWNCFSCNEDVQDGY
jgi:hypothetical protein